MLEVKRVRKDFDGLRAIDRASLMVPQGKIVGLIGPNGSGKSTMLNVISGMLPITGGNIIFDHTDITGLLPDKIFHLGLVRGFQNPALFTRMTVLDNTLLPAKRQRGENPLFAPLRRTWRKQESEYVALASEILKQIDLSHQYHQYASDLSGGQMKLLELSRALITEPKMLLLDEPTAGVAPKLAYSIFEQIARMRDELGITFLIVEHRLEILFDFADEVYVMHMGNVIAHDTPNAITANETVREVYFGDE